MDSNLQDNENQPKDRNTITSDNRNPSQSNQKNDDLFSLFMVPNKEFLDKSKDIDTLSKMRQLIIKYETGQSQIEDVLKIIGDLSSRITYNDINSNYIRNKYGFICRNKNKDSRFNENGIYFESLSYLKNILSDNSICDSIPEVEINNLGPELNFLKQKIDLILSEQNSTNNDGKSFDQSVINISKLTGFAMKYHEQMVLWRIFVEMKGMEDIDFRLKADRYYFGRVYSIIGELFNEWLQDQKNMEQNMFIKTLKKFIKLRDKLVHYHERINSLTESDNESINKIIVELKNHLKFIIMDDQSNKLLSIGLACDSTEEFNKLLNDLSTWLFGKSMKAKNDTTKKNEDERSNDEKIKKILHRCIIKAIEIIDGTSEQSNIDNKSINKQIKIFQSINKNYKTNLNKLSEEERKNFPSTLDLDHIEEMKSLENNLVQNLSTSPSIPSHGLLDKFLKKMTMIMDEINNIYYFFPRLLDDNKIQPNKIRYIFQYSILVIGQLVRDIENFKICQSNHNNGDSNVNNQSNSADLTGFAQSNMIREAASRLKTLRNEGLAHNVWNFDEDSYIKNIYQIRPAIDLFLFVYYFIKKDSMPENCESLYCIGCYWMHSNKYVEAIDYLEKCRIRLSDYPNEEKEEFFSFYQYNDLEKICHMKPILWFTLINLALSYSKIKNSEKSKEIALYLLDQVDYDEDSDIVASRFKIFLEHLCEIFTILKDNLDLNVYIELLESFDERYGNFIFKFKIGEFYKEQKNYEKAEEVFKYIFENSPKTNDKINSFGECLNICLKHKRLDSISEIDPILDEKAEAVLKDIFEITPKTNDKINSFEECLNICLKQNRLDSTFEIDTVLDPMLAWFRDNKIDLPLNMLEPYFIFKLGSLFLRLKSIQYNICFDGINESEEIELRELSTQFKEIFTKLHNFNWVSEVIEEFIKSSWIFILVLSLDIGTGLDASLVPKVFNGKPDLTPNEMENMTTLSKIITHLINKDRELKKTNLHFTNERNGLSMEESGDCLCQYAQWFLMIYLNNHSNIAAGYVSQALFRYAIKCFQKCKYCKYCNGQIKTDALLKIFYCHISLNILICSLPSLIHNISKFKCLSTDEEPRITLEKIAKPWEDIRDETISVLNQILEASNDNFKLNIQHEFVFRYLAKHFDIRINKYCPGKSLIYEGTFGELQNKIRLHVNSNYMSVYDIKTMKIDHI